jgi:hypothetical protein
MTTNRFLPLLGLCTTLVLAALPTHAGLIIGNLDSTPVSANGFALVDIGASQGPLAFGFTMPSGTGYSLDSVTVTIGVTDLTFSPALSSALYADAGGVPGATPLVTFSSPSIAAGPSSEDYVLTPTTAFTLQPGTTYWFAATGSLGGAGDMYWEVRNDVAPSGIATSEGYLSNNGSWQPFTASSPALRIDGTAVPVPAPLALMLAGLAGIGAVRLGRKSGKEPLALT